MRNWLLIAGAGALVGYAVVYFAFSGSSAPEPEAEQSTAHAPQPTEPVVLSQVVEVMDTDPLLDPLPGQPSGAPFDPADPLEAGANVNALSTVAPAPIPPSVE